MSVAFAGSKHVGGTADIDEAPGRAKARLFDDITFMGGESFVSHAKTILTLEPWQLESGWRGSGLSGESHADDKGGGGGGVRG